MEPDIDTGVAENLPFGQFAIVVDDPITVPTDADDAALERARQTAEQNLNAVTARADAIAGGRHEQA